MSMKRMLIVGGIPNKKKNIEYGGATVLMQNFIDYLYKYNVKFKFAQTNKYSGYKLFGPLLNKLYFLFSFIIGIRKTDIVMFNFSDYSTVYNFPLLSSVAKFFNKKVVLRKFGGTMDNFLSAVPVYRINRMLKSMRNSDVIFFETKSSIVHIKELLGLSAPPIIWFPNNRYASVLRKNPMNFNKRLVFLSHMKDEKGVNDILEVAGLLPSDYRIDLYGSIKDKKYTNFDFSKYGVTYHGEIASDLVGKVLCDASILLLPSYREGYPGIIIEAMSVGLPIVASNVGGIPEMMTDYKEGRIVRAGDVEELRSAILSITVDNYESMCENAFRTYQQNFNSDIVNEKVLKYIMML